MDKDLKRAIEHELKYLSEYRARLEQLKLDLLDKGSCRNVAVDVSVGSYVH